MVEEKSKIKKKKWVVIKSPKSFGDRELGETTVDEMEKAMVKTITVNAMSILNDPRKQHINLTFKATEMEGQTAVRTKIVGYEIVPSSLKRFIRRSKDKMDDSFLLSTKDDVVFRIKPFFITNSNAARSTRSEIRRKAFEVMARESRKVNFDNLILNVLAGKLQKAMRDNITKVFPLKICEIRVIKIETNKKRIKNYKPVEIIETEEPKAAKEEADEEAAEQNEEEQGEEVGEEEGELEQEVEEAEAEEESAEEEGEEKV